MCRFTFLLMFLLLCFLVILGAVGLVILYKLIINNKYKK